MKYYRFKINTMEIEIPQKDVYWWLKNIPTKELLGCCSRCEAVDHFGIDECDEDVCDTLSQSKDQIDDVQAELDALHADYQSLSSNIHPRDLVLDYLCGGDKLLNIFRELKQHELKQILKDIGYVG